MLAGADGQLRRLETGARLLQVQQEPQHVSRDLPDERARRLRHQRQSHGEVREEGRFRRTLLHCFQKDLRGVFRRRQKAAELRSLIFANLFALKAV